MLEKNVGEKGLSYVFTYVPSSEISYETNFGMSLKDYSAAWHKKYADSKVEFGFNSVAGYTTGLVLEKTLATAESLDQLELRKAVFALSGNLKTLDGTFELDTERRADRRDHAARPIPARQRSPEADDGVAARGGQRQTRLSAAVMRRSSRVPIGGAHPMLIYSLLAGLLFGLYFSLIGLGLNLIFGVMRIVNLAHGDFLMLGAFLAFWLFTLFAINPVPAIAIAFIVFAIAGVPIYYLLVPRLLRAKDPEMLSFILFFGLAQVIEAVTTIAFRHQRALDPRQRAWPGDRDRSRACSPDMRSRAGQSRFSARHFRRRGWQAASPAAARCCWSMSICTRPGWAISPAR